MTIIEKTYSIIPTSNKDDTYSDIALTGLFNAHVALLNSERQAIWQRYNVMVLANSLIVVFLTQGDREKNEIILAAIFGLLLCFVWWKISSEGWKVFSAYRNLGLRFSWAQFDTKDNKESNPLALHLEVENKRMGGPILLYARFIILLFMGIYLLLGLSKI